MAGIVEEARRRMTARSCAVAGGEADPEGSGTVVFDEEEAPALARRVLSGVFEPDVMDDLLPFTARLTETLHADFHSLPCDVAMRTMYVALAQHALLVHHVLELQRERTAGE